MQAARAVNDVLRFLLELAALSGLTIWGWYTGPTGVNIVLAIGAPAVAAAVWGAFVAPKASRHPGDPWRLLLELAVFGSGTLAFAAAGAGWVAIVVGVLAALHLVATFPLGQRRPWVDAKPA